MRISDWSHTCALPIFGLEPDHSVRIDAANAVARVLVPRLQFVGIVRWAAEQRHQAGLELEARPGFIEQVVTHRIRLVFPALGDRGPSIAKALANPALVRPEIVVSLRQLRREVVERKTEIRPPEQRRETDEQRLDETGSAPWRQRGGP